jgi:hypothetical protein
MLLPLVAEITGSIDGSRTSEIAMTKRFQFQLRGATGSVTVSFQANEDPERWGYGTLGLTWPSELAKGLPVINAHTECSLEGYAATMGWIQIVRIDVLESSQPMAVGVERAPVGHHEWVDGPPHLRGLGVPFTSFGECPTLFDAPASTESDTTFFADSFLTASPDALISRVSFPILGIRWGYSTRARQTHKLHEPTLLDGSHWADTLPLLRETFPDWQFRSKSPS